MSNKKVYVLYGSQTGNAESIAKELHEYFSRENISNELLALNKAKGKRLQDDCLVAFIVCSTTGNGDCPESADAWWRTVKLRSAAKTLFEGVNFAVLGLGDTNYDKFCHMGKSIDKRLAELSGNRVIPLHCADEATNLEETVEKWKRQVKALVKTLLEAEAKQGESTACSEEKSIIEGESAVPAEKSTCKDAVDKDKKEDACVITTAEKDILLDRLQTLPEGLLTLAQVADAVGETERFQTPPAPVSPLKSSGRSSNNADKAHVYILKDANGTHSVEARKGGHEWTFEHPFTSNISIGKWLSSSTVACHAINESKDTWGSEKRVVYCELDLQGSKICYQPGDSIGVCCPNPPYIIDLVLKRLREAHPEDNLNFESIIELKEKEKSEKMTLGELLQFKFDLVGLPKKALLNALALCCQDEKECLQMQLLTGRDAFSKLLWTHFIEQQGLGAAEILHLFPSCKPTLSQLVSALSPMPPRYYSIASAQESNCNRVAFAFSLVRNVFSVKRTDGTAVNRILRSGLCTSYLEYIMRHQLYPSLYPSSEPKAVLRIFHKATLSFHLPGSVHHPLILIGPGTGVAPFISFLEHRSHLEQDRKRSSSGGEVMSSGVWRGGFELDELDLPCEGNQVNKFIHSVKPGPIHLFYGCRNEDDYLFRSVLEKFVSDGTLTSLDVAMSRVDLQQKCYVQHKIAEKAEELANLILNDGAYVYICGDGNQMAKDVQATLKSVLIDKGGLSEEDAQAYMAELRSRRRLLLDIWS